MNIKRLFNIKKRNVFYVLIAVLLLVLSLSFFEESAVEPDYEVMNFANEIIKDYSGKNDYSGMMILRSNLTAGDENAQPLGFGSKSFMISSFDVEKQKCISLILGSMQDNISLISIKINEQEFLWGNGLPINYDDIEKLCVEKNKIVWKY